MDDEIKKKAAEALRAGADAARTLGEITCALGQKGYAAAVDKARNLRERAKVAKEKADEKRMEKQRLAEEKRKEEQMRAETDRAREMERLEAERQCEAAMHAVRQGPSNCGAPELPGDPDDKEILLSYGWLYFIWWLGNIIYTIIFIIWLSAATSRYSSGNTAWIPMVFWLLALLFNRLAYEGAVAFFEMVRHLRQIRDELRRHNMREEARDRAAWEARQQAEAPAEADPQNANGIASEGDNTDLTQ